MNAALNASTEAPMPSNVTLAEELRVQVEGALLMSGCSPARTVEIALKEVARFVVAEYGAEDLDEVQELFETMLARAFDEAQYEGREQKG